MKLEEQILNIIRNSHNDAWLSRQSHVKEPVINRYRNGTSDIKNMTLGVAEKILNVYATKKE